MTEELTVKKPNGNKGRSLSEEHKAKLSAALKGKKATKAFTGRSHTQETKAKMSKAKKGKPLSEENKAHLETLRLSNIGRKLSLETRAKISKAKKGRVLSAETRAKMSAASMGRIFSQETRAKISAANRGKNHDGVLVTEYNTQGTKASRAKAKIQPVVKRLKETQP